MRLYETVPVLSCHEFKNNLKLNHTQNVFEKSYTVSMCHVFQEMGLSLRSVLFGCSAETEFAVHTDY